MPQRDRIRWHLFPEIRLTTQSSLDLSAADPLASALPDLMQVMDLQQEQIARTLGEGHRVVHGAAGSGKTMILIYRAQMLAAAAGPGQPILVMCFNRVLADRIESLLRARRRRTRAGAHFPWLVSGHGPQLLARRAGRPERRRLFHRAGRPKSLRSRCTARRACCAAKVTRAGLPPATRPPPSKTTR